MWLLRLNDMRSPKIEMLRDVALAETREILMDYVLKQRTLEPYTDGEWNKVFQKDGPLEWFNPPYEKYAHEHFIPIGTLEDWIQNAKEGYQSLLSSVPQIYGETP